MNTRQTILVGLLLIPLVLAQASQQQKLVAADAEADDQFGESVAMSGETVVLGAFGEDSGGGAAGAAYVFTRSGTTWTQQQKLVASDAQAGDQFGEGVAIDTDTVVVGAVTEDAGGADAGAAYVFTRSGTTWTQQQKLVASDPQAGDQFGGTVGISGETVVVGAPTEDTGGSNAGAAYVFTRSGTTWTQQQKLVASDAQAGDQFGRVVAVDSDTVVVGAPLEDAGGADAGAAYVFTRSGTTWTQQQKLVASDPQAGDQFGGTVGISGETVVVGAPTEDTGGSNAGAAYVFTRSGTTWTQQQKLVASDAQADDQFGALASISLDSVLIGAPLEDTGGSNAGAAYVFTRSGSTWSEEAKLVPDDATAGDNFGGGLSIDAGTAVVGSPGNDDAAMDAGAFYVFTRAGTTWTQQEKLLASDPQAGDAFGAPLWVDGESAIIGAPLEDTGGSAAGAAYIFTGIFVSDPTEDVEPTFEPRPVEPGGIFGDNGAAFGGDKAALAASMEISVTALEIGMAILWILLFTAIGFLTFNRSMAGALSGGLGGVVWSIAWGLIPLWFVFMLIILTGAGLLVLRRRA